MNVFGMRGNCSGESTEFCEGLAAEIKNIALTGGMKTFMVTSSLPGEGVSSIAYHLSRCLNSFEQCRVLLVEANFRDSRSTRYFRQADGKSLAELLASHDPCPEYRENFSIIRADGMPSRPPLLLGSKRMDELVVEWKAQFDMVIFDTAPVIPFPDPLVLAKHVEAVILVVEAGKTRMEVVRKALEKFREGDCDFLRIVLNKYRKVIPRWIYRFL